MRRIEETALPVQPVYLREWLAALGLQQGKVALDAGVNEGYVSQLVNREKYPEKAPSVGKVQQIGRAMGVPWHLLYQPPPPDPIPMHMLAKYPDDLIRRIAAARARRTA